MKNDLGLRDIYNAIQDFREEVRGTYVTKEEFKPIKAVVFGMAGSVLLAFLNTILKSKGL